jgi:low temperature requirement protein LtrA
VPLFGHDSRHTQPLLRPPRLQTLADAEDERHASWLELFFDLVFVVAIAQLAHELVEDHSLLGFAIFAALFVPVFVAWQGFSFYADRFDTDDVVFRVVMLVAMLAIAALAVQIPEVTHGQTVGFAVAYVALRVLTISLYVRAFRHVPEARSLIGRYILAFSFSVALWTVSLAFPAPWRFVLWGIGLAVDIGVPAFSGPRFVRRIPLHASHIPERFALFTIIVLGESVVAIALGTAGNNWQTSSAVAAGLGFVAVACLWWIYFDVGAGLALRPGPMVAISFIYTHLPMLTALTAVAAGVSLLIKEAGASELDTGTRWALCGGAAVYLCCVSVVHRATAQGVVPAIVRARLVVAGLLVALIFAGAGLHSVTFAALLLAILVTLVAFETARNLRPDAHPPPQQDKTHGDLARDAEAEQP